jgi:hypothetical protein
MALSTYALVTLPELRGYMDVQGTTQDTALEDSINRATTWLEEQTSRKFITRGEVGEYHTVRPDEHTIRLGEWPIISVTSVHESTDSPRAYDADSLLTANTEYQLIAESGLIRRLSSSELTWWARGYRAIKVLYHYGYANEAAIPADLKLLCLFVATSMFKESDRARWGVSSVTDAAGSVTRFLGYLPPDMKAHLLAYQRVEFERTWEAA